MDNFFSTIIYSASNEDSLSELKALQLTSQDTVLTITGSGARALDLLIDGPKKIISIDMNKRQNFLLHLKIQAYQQLEYCEFKAFLGLDDCDDRLAIYDQLKNGLTSDAKQYWDNESDKIQKGVLYCGVWESYLLKLSWLTKFRASTIEQLFNAATLEEQSNIWNNQWDGFFWQQFIKILNVRWIWKYLLKEPGIDLIDKKLHIGRYIHDRLTHVVGHQSVKKNPFLNLIIFGKYNDDCLPLHLQACHFDTIKQSVEKIETVTQPIDEYLNENPDSIDAFSISDFSSYANKQQYQSIWRSVMLGAKKGARICERFFLVNYQPEKIEGVNIKRNVELEQKLLDQDHSFIYSFNCAKIEQDTEHN
ncbi:DUF3419 family protein [Marinicellulosiphila megalodicopiae]|uniref:DUF3419 family protein n=1 Tax=Marinicellulosiphila megalodicopiae TaxID=2724896 RepID=UPI003BAF7BE8